MAVGARRVARRPTTGYFMAKRMSFVLICASSVFLPAAWVEAGAPGPAPPAKATPAGRLDKAIDVAVDRLAEQLAEKLPRSATVAVLPFLDANSGAPRLGMILSDALQGKLFARKVVLVDREHLNNLLAERQIKLAGLEKGISLKEAGKVAGADVLVFGKLARIGPNIVFSAKATAVKDSLVVAVGEHQSIPAGDVGHVMWYVQRPDKPADQAALPPLALCCEFVTPANGGEAELKDGATVASQQKFKIRIQPNSDCFLYVLLLNSRNELDVLFPHARIGLSNDVRGGVRYTIPGPAKSYRFDANTGTETFYAVASYKPLKDLGRILLKTPEAGAQRAGQAQAAKTQIEGTVTRGMTRRGSSEFLPKGFAIQRRGGGTADLGWGTRAEMDARVAKCIAHGYATVVKTLTLRHK